MERITAQIRRPHAGTTPHTYGIVLTLLGSNPSVYVNWGDGTGDTYHGKNVKAIHFYSLDWQDSFKVEFRIESDRIEYVYPAPGSCVCDSIDFSEAPSILAIAAQQTKKFILDNPNLEYLTLYLNLGDEYDLSRCPKLRVLRFQQLSDKLKTLDLSYCHKLEKFSMGDIPTPGLRNIIFAQDAPLHEVDIRGNNLSHASLDAIRRIVERNNGIFEDKERRIWNV